MSFNASPFNIDRSIPGRVYVSGIFSGAGTVRGDIDYSWYFTIHGRSGDDDFIMSGDFESVEIDTERYIARVNPHSDGHLYVTGEWFKLHPGGVTIECSGEYGIDTKLRATLFFSEKFL
jgi:hypothetical protein